MQVTAHCFTYGVKINRVAFSFPFKDMILSVSSHTQDKEEGLMLELSKKVNSSEFSVENEVRDDKGIFIAKRMQPYKVALTEAANLIEGMFSILYLATPPKFETDKIIVNVLPETPEEEELIKSGKVTGGFGNVGHPIQRPIYQINEKFLSASTTAIEHLPALSFLAQGIRSQSENDQEIAFFLYFRIIDGYFSDGVKDVEAGLLKKSTDIAKYLNYEDEAKDAVKSILNQLKLSSKSHSNFEGFISDLVLIRHKLTHFSKTNADRHHRADLQFDLNIINFHLRIANTRLLLDQLGVK